MIAFDFDHAHWHDAELRSVQIDRRSPGVADDVLLQVVWPDTTASVVRFHDCYRFQCSMNFGVIATETIRTATCAAGNKALDEIRNRWSAIDVRLSDLKEYRFETNPTGSILRIFARAVSATESCT